MHTVIHDIIDDYIGRSWHIYFELERIRIRRMSYMMAITAPVPYRLPWRSALYGMLKDSHPPYANRSLHGGQPCSRGQLLSKSWLGVSTPMMPMVFEAKIAR